MSPKVIYGQEFIPKEFQDSWNIEDARRNPSLAPLDRSERRTWPYLGRHEPPFCGNGVGIPPRGMGI
jgi:hypothetical protein